MDFNAQPIGIYIRIVAIISLMLGLNDAARLLGVGLGDVSPVTTLGMTGFVYLGIFGLARLFAAVGQLGRGAAGRRDGGGTWPLSVGQCRRPHVRLWFCRATGSAGVHPHNFHPVDQVGARPGCRLGKVSRGHLHPRKVTSLCTGVTKNKAKFSLHSSKMLLITPLRVILVRTP
jgi:hypothetical protein